MSVSPLSSINSFAATDASSAPATNARVPKKTLDQDDFFKLLAVQFSSQDPLKPMEDTTFIAEMANFTSLEMMGDLTDQFKAFNSQQGFASAQGLLGRKVTLWDSKDTEVTGVVSAVRNDGDDTLITVNGADYEVGTVRRVELTSSNSTTNP